MGKKLTHEEFINRVLQNNKHYSNGDFDIVGQYIRSDEPVECHCNIHDFNWEPLPYQLWMGQGCSLCGTKATADKSRFTHEQFVEKLLIKNKYYANGDFELLEKYTNNRNNIRCKCNICGYEWNAPSSKLPNEYRCHRCKMEENRIKQEQKLLVRLKELYNGDIIMVDKYVGATTKIRFQCKHGHTWLAEPHNVDRGHGCPYCCGHKVLVGFNDLWTTRPDIARLLLNPEDGYKYTKAAHVKLDFVCPDCGKISKIKINDVYNRGFSCSRCSDGISYPNKFARNLLDQLPVVNHICEYHPDWAELYFYDNYFEYNNKSYILEMDGGFHYRDVTSYNQFANDVRATDIIKTELANKHGIKVIRIDCQKSDCNYIKNNIISSELSDIFDLFKIDWDLCNEMAHKNLLKQACNLYESGITNFQDIADILKVHRTTAYHYVKTGTKYGWCDYDPKRATKEAVKHGKRSIPIVILDDNLNIIYNFCSIHECEEQIRKQYGIGLWRKKIVDACKTHEPYHGFNFRFASEFNNNN